MKLSILKRKNLTYFGTNWKEKTKRRLEK